MPGGIIIGYTIKQKLMETNYMQTRETYRSILEDIYSREQLSLYYATSGIHIPYENALANVLIHLYETPDAKYTKDFVANSYTCTFLSMKERAQITSKDCFDLSEFFRAVFFQIPPGLLFDTQLRNEPVAKLIYGITEYRTYNDSE